MKHLWRALFIVLALSAFMPGRSAAQGTLPQTGRGQGAGFRLEQNFPNPVTQDTRIRFAVSDDCTDSGRQHRVSLRIYNLLAQLVAVPVLQAGVGNAGGGEPLEALLLTCSTEPYVAYWNGKSSQTGEDVASGIYLFRLEVDGKVLVKKMIVRR